jgi:hypothetical protein
MYIYSYIFMLAGINTDIVGCVDVTINEYTMLKKIKKVGLSSDSFLFVKISINILLL